MLYDQGPPESPPSGAGTASPATDDFLKWWRMEHTRKAFLAQIVLSGGTSPATQTIYLADELVWAVAPDGVREDAVAWQPALDDCDDILAPGELLACGPDLCSAIIKVSRIRLHYQTSGDALDSLKIYRWEGAAVTLLLWVQGHDGTTHTCQVFSGVANRPTMGMSQITLNLLQDRTWTRSIPTAKVTEADWPNAPEGNWGKVIPVVIGNWKAAPMRRPWPDPYLLKLRQEQLGGGCLMIPGLCVDRGSGPDSMKMIFACHLLMDTFATGVAGESVFCEGASWPSVVSFDPTIYVHPTLAFDGSYFTVDDEVLRAAAAALGADVRILGDRHNTAEHPRYSMDPRDEVTYALVDPANSMGTLQLIMPTLMNMGAMDNGFWAALYRTSGATQQVDICQQAPDFADGDSYHRQFGGSLEATVGVTLADADWIQKGSWNFGLNDAGKNSDLALTMKTSGWAKIFLFGIIATYKPDPKVNTPAVQGYKYDAQGRLVPYESSVGGSNYYGIRRGAPAIVELASSFQANCRGYPDNDWGDFTGTAGALVERVPDVVKLILSVWGGVDLLTGFQDGEGFGSFVTARELMRTKENNQITVSMHLDRDDDTTATVLQALAYETMAMVFLDRFDGKWKLAPWIRRPAPDYPYTIRRADILGDDGLEAETGSDTSVVNAVEVQYGLEPYNGNRLWKALVNQRDSGMGFEVIGDSDQSLVVLASEPGPGNDTIIFSHPDGVKHTVVLDSGTYTPMELAAEIQAKMRTESASDDWWAGWGVAVRANANNQVRLTHDSTLYELEIQEDLDHTPESMAAEVANTINTYLPALAATCTYNRGTGLFTLTVAESITLELGNMDQPIIWPALGFQMGTNRTGTSFTSDFVIKQEHFWIAYGGTDAYLNLEDTDFTAANLLGYYCGTDQMVEARVNLGTLLADVRRGNRETLAATSAASDRYGEKRPVKVQSDFIRETVVATHLRDTILDFRCFPPVFITLRTNSCPDIQRGRVFRLASDVDTLMPYPGHGSDGSWEGRCFRVLGVTQNSRAPYDQQIRAVEVLPGIPVAATTPGSSHTVEITEDVNDMIHWGNNALDEGPLYSYQIPAGTWDCKALAIHLTEQMRAIGRGTEFVGFGTWVIEGHTDRFDIFQKVDTSYVRRTVTIPTGDYSPRALATAVNYAVQAITGQRFQVTPDWMRGDTDAFVDSDFEWILCRDDNGAGWNNLGLGFGDEDPVNHSGASPAYGRGLGEADDTWEAWAWFTGTRYAFWITHQADMADHSECAYDCIYPGETHSVLPTLGFDPGDNGGMYYGAATPIHPAGYGTNTVRGLTLDSSTDQLEFTDAAGNVDLTLTHQTHDPAEWILGLAQDAALLLEDGIRVDLLDHYGWPSTPLGAIAGVGMCPIHGNWRIIFNLGEAGEWDVTTYLNFPGHYRGGELAWFLERTLTGILSDHYSALTEFLVTWDSETGIFTFTSDVPFRLMNDMSTAASYGWEHLGFPLGENTDGVLTDGKYVVSAPNPRLENRVWFHIDDTDGVLKTGTGSAPMLALFSWLGFVTGSDRTGLGDVLADVDMEWWEDGELILD